MQARLPPKNLRLFVHCLYYAIGDIIMQDLFSILIYKILKYSLGKTVTADQNIVVSNKIIFMLKHTLIKKSINFVNPVIFDCRAFCYLQKHKDKYKEVMDNRVFQPFITSGL